MSGMLSFLEIKHKYLVNQILFRQAGSVVLVTVFLVLVNIFNSITSNIPRADGLTAIESFIIVCIVFVFGALIGRIFVSIFIRALL